jgi:hypothetical protein
MADKVFVGNVKTVKTQYGEIIKLGINTTDIKKMQDNLDQRGWVNLEILTKRDGGKYMVVDDHGK